MTHRQILEALSGMLLAMFVAFLSSTVVSNALPTIITDLRGTQSQYTWVVTATLLASTASTPDLGQARRPVQQEAADPARDRHLHRRLDAGRSLPVGGDAHRLARAAGPGPRRPAGARADRDGGDDQPARAGPVLRPPRRRHGRRDRRRPAARRPAGRHELAGLALVLLRRRPLRRRRAGPAAAHAAPAGDQARRAHRLPRRRLPHRRRLRAADLGDPGRRQLRLDVDRVGAVRRRRRCWRSSPSWSPRCGPRSRSSRCGSSATGRRRWPSSPASPSVWRCSARRSSSASTCRSRAATRRRRPAC